MLLKKTPLARHEVKFMKTKHRHNAAIPPDAGEATTTAEPEESLNSVTEPSHFREPGFHLKSNQPLDYDTIAVEHAIPIFDALHRLAGNPQANLRNPDRTKPLPWRTVSHSPELCRVF